VKILSMEKHPNVLRFSSEPLQRRLYQHWREKYGTLILQSQEREKSRERLGACSVWPTDEASERTADLATIDDP
jgi:hypothetical protein